MSPEVPLEQSHEEIMHHAEHSSQQWFLGVALTAAILAVVAALAALQAEHTATHAMLEQIECSDQWNFFQAKSLKQAIAESRAELLQTLGKPADAKLQGKIQRYDHEKDETKEKAEELRLESEMHLKQNRTFSTAVTLSQIAIAIGAVSVLARRKEFWYLAILMGVIGAGFLGLGFLHPYMPNAPAHQEAASTAAEGK